jgi:5-methylcytosine-specific restriction enzyme subunit McrC
LPFKQLASISRRIASGLGYNATDMSGRDEGILVDVAELWELFVVNCTRQAVPAGIAVEHGTHSSRRDFLLRSVEQDRQIGRIKPDVLITKGDVVVAIIDAKYKRLRNTLERPYGIDQADLYQLAAYSMRFKPKGISMLGYPKSDDDDSATAGLYGPWVSDGRTFVFEPLPTQAAACREALTVLLASVAD